VKRGSVGRAGCAGRDHGHEPGVPGPDNTITLICSGTVASIDFPQGFECRMGSIGSRRARGLSFVPFVIITSDAVDGSLPWRVPDASAWHFINGHPLCAVERGFLRFAKWRALGRAGVPYYVGLATSGAPPSTRAP